MTAYYFPSDVNSVFVGETGHLHGGIANAKGEEKLDRASKRVECPDGTTRLVIDCRECEPYLPEARGRANPADASLLTFDEARERADLSQQQRALMATMSSDLAGHVVRQMQAASAAPAPKKAAAGGRRSR